MSHGMAASSGPLGETGLRLMNGYLIVALGSALGGALRHGVNVGSARLIGIDFPCGTFIVNVVGSLAMGLLAGYFAFKGDALQSWRLFFTTGILGGFTTFSAFSLDFAMLYERGEVVRSLGYAFGSVGLSIMALFAGLAFVRLLG